MYFNRRSINFSKRKVGEDIILPKKSGRLIASPTKSSSGECELNFASLRTQSELSANRKRYFLRFLIRFRTQTDFSEILLLRRNVK